MRLTLIGHLCKDIVHHSGNGNSVPEQTFGGIYFSLLALANLAAKNDVISPVFGVGNGDYEPMLASLKPYPNIDTDGIFKFKGHTNEVHLFYQPDRKARVECSKDIAQAIPYSRIKPFLDSDGILINMISGLDISIETMDAIRMETRERRIPIHFDFHSLTLGIDQEFKRFRRPLSDWRRWCFMLNSVQMSEEEAAGLSAEEYDEPTLINQLMPLMVSALLITRGDRGATLVHQDIHKKLTRHEVPPFDGGAVVDSTGCGDVFGAAFLYEYVRTGNHLQAAIFANKAAAINATLGNAYGLACLQERLGLNVTGEVS